MSAPGPTVLERERHGGVEVLRLNRAEARNAFNPELAGAVHAAFVELDADPAVQAVVITGAGEHSFSAGADLKALAAGTIRPGTISLLDVCQRGLAKPLIAAVNGTCLAGGLELALTCDLIVAIEDAVFGLPEVKRGLVAGAGGVTRVCQRIGLAPALEIILTGDPIDAQRALALGLINRIVTRAELLPTALGLAQRIAQNAPVALRLGKQLAHDVIGASEVEAFKLNQVVLEAIRQTEDSREGPLAFAQKRKPVWKGR
jgi:enoyl-CoA hydratase/carnithine racemase